MTMAATMTPPASDLASDFVQECLGFTSQKSKLHALHQIYSSLQSCFGGSSDNDDVAITGAVGSDSSLRQQAHQEWREFLEGHPSAAADGYADSDFMLRDSLIKCLVESCHMNDENGAEEREETESILDVVELSLICLTYLVSLRCVEKNGTGKKKASKVAPIFGPDFVSTIASHVVEALRLDDGSAMQSSGVPHAASGLLIALLRSDRPRNEISDATIRDSILLPSCSKDTSTGSVACIAQVLSTSIIAAVEYAVPATDAMDEEELSMRRETAALNRLQDMRDVLMNVGLHCSQGLIQDAAEAAAAGTADDSIGPCSQRILNATQEIYDIAAFAVESQLESLLEEKATPILTRLSKESTNQADKMNISSTSLGEEYDSDLELGEDVKMLGEVGALPPLYAKIAKPPVILTSVKDLESMLVDITESLNTTDAELWDERLNALIDIERILAGGVASMSKEARHLFIEKLRKMQINGQFTDLRSQITQQACRVIIAMAYEYRDFVGDDQQLNQAVCHFVECSIQEGILKLCKSGTKLMANQGMNCLLCLAAVSGNGYPRTIPRFCDEIIGKKVHKNQKRGSVMALTAALRVWDSNCFVKHLDQLTNAVKEGATNRDPAVREEGRKLYWAMHACNETSHAVQSMFDGRSREMKNLMKEKEDIDSAWGDEGVMSILVQTGVLGQAPEQPAKKSMKSQSRISAPTGSGVPPRNSIKRPASVRLRAVHGTPFKSQRVSTPMKSASVVSSSSKIRPPSSANSRSQISTPSIRSTTATTMKFSESKSVNCNNHVSSSTKFARPRPSTAPSKQEDALNFLHLPSTGKENSVAMRTPAKSAAYNGVTHAPSPLMGTPVVNLLARAAPLSAEKVMETGDVLGAIISMLSDRLSPHEQSLGIKALALFAKENPTDPSWDEKFPLVLGCLLDHIKKMPTAEFNGPVDFIRSPSKNLSDCHQMQHLFLQGVRSLLQFVSDYVKSEQVDDIVCCMLECTEDAPFEIIHTAERALHNLVTGADPQTCFESLLPFTSVQVDLNDKSNPTALLSTLRTMKYLVDKIPPDSLTNALPSLLSLFHTTLSHKSVDMRKATVFVLVEMHFVLGDELGLNGFTDCQRRLIDVYIERHPKRMQMTVEAVPKSSTQQIYA